MLGFSALLVTIGFMSTREKRAPSQHALHLRQRTSLLQQSTDIFRLRPGYDRTAYDQILRESHPLRPASCIEAFPDDYLEACRAQFYPRNAQKELETTLVSCSWGAAVRHARSKFRLCRQQTIAASTDVSNL